MRGKAEERRRNRTEQKKKSRCTALCSSAHLPSHSAHSFHSFIQSLLLLPLSLSFVIVLIKQNLPITHSFAPYDSISILNYRIHLPTSPLSSSPCLFAPIAHSLDTTQHSTQSQSLEHTRFRQNKHIQSQQLTPLQLINHISLKLCMPTPWFAAGKNTICAHYL